MANKITFLSISDPRGDLDFVAKAIALAQRKDVRADGIFLLGNFCGPLLSRDQQYALSNARRTLEKELEVGHVLYREQGINKLWDFIDFAMQNPDRFRRGGVPAAIDTMRKLVGIQDRLGNVVQFGKAAKMARTVYGKAVKLFGKSRIPCYLMADTILAEEVVPEDYWLHFSWVSIAGFSVRCLGPTEIEDWDAISEYFLGAKRGGVPVRLENYPIGGADIIFSYTINPVLHEVLSSAMKKLVVVSGKGQIDTSYTNNILSTQQAGHAYVYAVDGTQVLRQVYRMEQGSFERVLDEGGEQATSTKFHRRDIARAELETKMRLAGIGQDLKMLIDFLRVQNPDLAAQIDRADNRAEAVLRYVKYLEEERTALRAVISTERAGFERLLHKLAGFLSEKNCRKLSDMLSRRPELAAGPEALDAANEEITEFLGWILAQTLGRKDPAQ